ncbi:MAG: cob(I)yrinic acid a,c-diamide adenosyltransferase [candidate division Zixibacteria bacterium]|nr:cob(I)yrinic acid a,c-diamide adenosyltransferase [candidate division Zixibacteria bacterium]
MAEEDKKKKGLLIVYTGDGKGKTTASLGMVVRAVGYNWKVAIFQFVKGSWKYGELEGIKKLAPNVELEVLGAGFVGIVDDDKPIEEHRRVAKEAVETVRQKILSDKYDLVILDELNVALSLGLISQDEVESIIENKPERLFLVITGRGAAKWLIDRADLVTEMKEIKHPYQKGILAQKGIDF